MLTTTGNIGGFAMFRYNPTGQEAVVPLETVNANSYVLAFDNTGILSTGLAIANVAAQAAKVNVVIRDDTGRPSRHGLDQSRGPGPRFVHADGCHAGLPGDGGHSRHDRIRYALRRPDRSAGPPRRLDSGRLYRHHDSGFYKVESIGQTRSDRGEPDDGSHYYHHWLAILERLATSKGLSDPAAMLERKGGVGCRLSAHSPWRSPSSCAPPEIHKAVDSHSEVRAKNLNRLPLLGRPRICDRLLFPIKVRHVFLVLRLPDWSRIAVPIMML